MMHLVAEALVVQNMSTKRSLMDPPAPVTITTVDVLPVSKPNPSSVAITTDLLPISRGDSDRSPDAQHQGPGQ